MPTAEPTIFDPKALQAKAQADLLDAHQAHAGASLRLAKGEPDALADVEGLEREISHHEKTIVRLQAALTAHAKGSSAQAIADAAELEKQRLADVKRLSAEIEKASAKVVDVFDELAPLLGQLGRLGRERSAAAWGLVNGRIDQEDPRHNGYRNRIGRARPEQVLLAAIRLSGLGAVGPRIEPYVVISRSSQQLPEAALEDLKAQHARELEALLEAIGQASEPAPTDITTITEEATQ